MVICPSFTVSTPLPSQVSLAWNMLLSVLKSAVYTPSARAGWSGASLPEASVCCCPQPTKDTVTYPDGLSEEVNGFDIPVPALDTEFDVALIGKKGVWYDHKVSVSNPVLKEESGDDAAAITLADGTYTIEVGFEGGSGKSHVLTPCTLKVENGAATATIVWSSEKYDYMLVDGQRYDVLTTEGGSTFEIPVRALDTPLTVIGDTTAMSTPHEIEYTLTFDSSTAVEAAQ